MMETLPRLEQEAARLCAQVKKLLLEGASLAEPWACNRDQEWTGVSILL